MTLTTQTPLKARVSCDARRARRMLNDAAIRVFVPQRAQEGGIFRVRKGGPELLSRLSVQGIDALVAEGTLLLTRTTKAGRLYKVIPVKDRKKAPRTAREHREASWKVAERAFATPKPRSSLAAVPATSMADSPIGWLARRRGADGKPFLTRDEVAAAERLRNDFERSQLAPGVTQDWSRFLTSGVEGGSRSSAQERDLDNGASAARERLSEAMAALGPGLSDVALRVCCFLEGIEAIESSMHWSRRSGKVVLKISLQRLASFYEHVSVRGGAAIEAWQAETLQTDSCAKS